MSGGEGQRPTWARRIAIVNAYIAGENTVDIAVRFNISRQRVEQLARKHDVPKRCPAKRPKCRRLLVPPVEVQMPPTPCPRCTIAALHDGAELCAVHDIPSGASSPRQIAAEILPGREPPASADASARAGAFYSPSPGSHAPGDAARCVKQPPCSPDVPGGTVLIGDRLVVVHGMGR